jgi:hypothetical protein
VIIVFADARISFDLQNERILERSEGFSVWTSRYRSWATMVSSLP